MGRCLRSIEFRAVPTRQADHRREYPLPELRLPDDRLGPLLAQARAEGNIRAIFPFDMAAFHHQLAISRNERPCECPKLCAVPGVFALVIWYLPAALPHRPAAVAAARFPRFPRASEQTPSRSLAFTCRRSWLESRLCQPARNVLHLLPCALLPLKTDIRMVRVARRGKEGLPERVPAFRALIHDRPAIALVRPVRRAHRAPASRAPANGQHPAVVNLAFSSHQDIPHFFPGAASLPMSCVPDMLTGDTSVCWCITAKNMNRNGTYQRGAIAARDERPTRAGLADGTLHHVADDADGHHDDRQGTERQAEEQERHRAL